MFSTADDILDALADGHTLRIESEWDRSVRSYRTMVLDERDYQIGVAAYDGTRADRDASIRGFERMMEQDNDAEQMRAERLAGVE